METRRIFNEASLAISDFNFCIIYLRRRKNMSKALVHRWGESASQEHVFKPRQDRNACNARQFHRSEPCVGLASLDVPKREALPTKPTQHPDADHASGSGQLALTPLLFCSRICFPHAAFLLCLVFATQATSSSSYLQASFKSFWYRNGRSAVWWHGRGGGHQDVSVKVD